MPPQINKTLCLVQSGEWSAKQELQRFHAQANWNAVKKIYMEDGPSLAMVGREGTCLFHWYASLDKVTHKFICNFNTIIYAKTTRMQKQLTKPK